MLRLESLCNQAATSLVCRLQYQQHTSIANNPSVFTRLRRRSAVKRASDVTCRGATDTNMLWISCTPQLQF